MTVESRPEDCRCLGLSDEALFGDEAVAYSESHLSQNGLHWEDASHERAGYSCKWAGRYWILDRRQGARRLMRVSFDEWRAAASKAENDFEYDVEQVFNITGRGVAVAGHIAWGSVRDGQTLEVLDESGGLVTRVTATRPPGGGLLLGGPGQHLVRGGYRLKHRINDALHDV